MGYEIGQNERGFSALEGLIVAVVIAIIVAAGFLIDHKKHKDQPVASTNTNSSLSTAGTTDSISQLTANDAASESTTDNSADTTYQQDATSVNGPISNVGGAYNESNY